MPLLGRSTPDSPARLSRRAALAATLSLGAATLLPGCGPAADGPRFGTLEHVWGRRGISEGRLQKPRAMAIDDQDRLYIVDMTARIQVFDPDGKFLRGWSTPDHRNGRPTGLSIDRSGRVLVADTHYYRVLIYTSEGELVQTIGGEPGPGPGQFGLVTDVVQDRAGHLYVSEYGEWDRIQKLTPEGKFLLQWGGHGSAPGEFLRPQNMAIDDQDRIWVADACNHRIQVFDTAGRLLALFGGEGSDLGRFRYPYDIDLLPDGDLLVCEFSNHRIQRLSAAGVGAGFWGREGRAEGELYSPWALSLDSRGRMHVLDTNNHRMQRVRI